MPVPTKNRLQLLVLISIPIISIIMHFNILNKDLIGIHVWRQTQTQTVINNFCHEGMNILQPKRNSFADTDRLLLMEFPIMQWIFAVFFKIFGDHIIISRLLSYCIGLFSVYGIYKLVKTLFNNAWVAIIAAWSLNFSPSFYYYTICPMPDNFALCCAIWHMVFFWQYVKEYKQYNYIISTIFLCLATLAKLPFILYSALPLIHIFYLFRRNRQLKNCIAQLTIFALLMLPAISWYIYVIPKWPKNGVLAGMLNGNELVPRFVEILIGNIVSVLPELLINYAALPLFLAGWWYIVNNKTYRNYHFILLASTCLLICTYFIYEINMIDTVHDYYLFPFLPLIFIIISYGAGHMFNHKKLRYVAVLCIITLPVTAYLRINNRWDTTSPGFNPVYYSEKNTLQKLIPLNALCVVGNDESNYILLYYLNRKGWCFYNDDLTNDKLKYYIANGADYLFTDGSEESINKLHPFLGNKIYENETLRVYKLNNQ